MYSRSCAYLISNLLHFVSMDIFQFNIYIYITRKYYLKELFKIFIFGVYRTVFSSEIRVTLSVFNSFDPLCRYGRVLWCHGAVKVDGGPFSKI